MHDQNVNAWKLRTNRLRDSTLLHIMVEESFIELTKFMTVFSFISGDSSRKINGYFMDMRLRLFLISQF